MIFLKLCIKKGLGVAVADSKLDDNKLVIVLATASSFNIRFIIKPKTKHVKTSRTNQSGTSDFR